jgi:hypothetical protein
VEDLYQKETDIARQTAAENPQAMEFCEAVLVPFEKGFDLLNHQMKVEDVRIETTQLLAMAFNSLRWSQEQLMKGYYSPAVTMARNAWECWLNGAYLNLYPERLEEWKHHETRPRPWQMRSLVAEQSTGDTEERASFLEALNELYGGRDGHRYSGYSVLSHPSWEAIRILVRSDGDELSLRVGPDYDRHLFMLAFDSYSTAALFAAGLFLHLLSGDDQQEFIHALDSAREPVTSWRNAMVDRE